MRERPGAALDQAQRHVWRALSHGAPLPPGLLPDALLLETLVDAVAQRAYRRTAQRLVFVALGSLALAIVMTLSMNIAGFALLPLAWAILKRLSRPDRVTQRAIDALVGTLLPRVTVEAAPDLLRLSDALRIGSSHRFGQTDESLDQAYQRVNDALQSLLPYFQPDAPLAPAQRRALRHFVVWYSQTRPALAVSSLLLLGEAGDRGVARTARRWSRGRADERLQHAAAEYLRLIGERP